MTFASPPSFFRILFPTENENVPWGRYVLDPVSKFSWDVMVHVERAEPRFGCWHGYIFWRQIFPPRGRRHEMEKGAIYTFKQCFKTKFKDIVLKVTKKINLLS